MANTDRSKDVNVVREWAKLFLGIVLAIFGMGIVVISLFANPLGAIDYIVRFRAYLCRFHVRN